MWYVYDISLDPFDTPRILSWPQKVCIRFSKYGLRGSFCLICLDSTDYQMTCCYCMTRTRVSKQASPTRYGIVERYRGREIGGIGGCIIEP
jgi:hypothetical protein